MLWLYLHFPHLLLDSQTTKENEKPAVIVSTHTNSVIQYNQQATDIGIQKDMRLASAALLTNELGVHPYDERAEIAQLTQMADWLYLVTSDICILKPNGLLLRVTPMLTLSGGLQAYWHDVQQHLAIKGVRYHYATGYSAIAAQLLAKQQFNTISDNPQAIKTALNNTSLSLCDLPQQTIESLTRSGINTLHQLLQQPLSALAKRFDIQLITYLGRLTGELKHPHQFHQPKQHFQQHLILLFDIENVALVSAPLKRLLKDLEHYLTCCCEVAYQLSLTLHLRDSDPMIITIDALQGEACSNEWLKLCELKLSDLTVERPITEITLTATRTDSKESIVSTDLLNQQNGNTSPLALTSLLAAKIGHQHIHYLVVQQDYRPENSNRLSNDSQLSSAEKVPYRADERPSLLLLQPEKLNTAVTIKQGPERLVSGWWDGDGICRDYFVATDQDGAWLWVFRDQNQHWYLHGWFS